jgi:tetratricopeptide (TPR) repeat protein
MGVVRTRTLLLVYNNRVRREFSVQPLPLLISVVLIFFPLIFLPLISFASEPQTHSAFADLVARAKQASEENRLDDATRLYTRAVTIHPNWADGWWSLGTLEYDQNHFAKAGGDFKQVVKLQPANGTAHAMLGLCQFELREDALALENLLEADKLGIVNNDELRRVALFHMGVLELRAFRFADAFDTLHDLTNEGIKSPELFTALGEAALLINPQAGTQDNTSQSVIRKVGEAEAFAGQKQFDSADQIYTALISQNPEFPNLHFAYARMLLEAHSEDRALQEFRRELERDPKNVNSMLEIASVEFQQNSEDGLKYAEKASRLAPGLPFAHYMLGMLRLDTGDAAGAIPELEIVRKDFPKQPKIYFVLGSAYAQVGRKADAARARAEFVRLDTDSAHHKDLSTHDKQVPLISERQLDPAKPREGR